MGNWICVLFLRVPEITQSLYRCFWRFWQDYVPLIIYMVSYVFFIYLSILFVLFKVVLASGRVQGYHL